MSLAFSLRRNTVLNRTSRDWRDPDWTTIDAVVKGLPDAVRKQRSIVFGPNAIDIKAKPVVSLLVDEVLRTGIVPVTGPGLALILHRKAPLCTQDNTNREQDGLSKGVWQ